MQDRRTFPNFARPSTVTAANMKIWKDIFSGKLKVGYIPTFVGVIVDLLKIVDEQDEGGSERTSLKRQIERFFKPSAINLFQLHVVYVPLPGKILSKHFT